MRLKIGMSSLIPLAGAALFMSSGCKTTQSAAGSSVKATAIDTIRGPVHDRAVAERHKGDDDSPELYRIIVMEAPPGSTTETERLNLHPRPIELLAAVTTDGKHFRSPALGEALRVVVGTDTEEAALTTIYKLLSEPYLDVSVGPGLSPQDEKAQTDAVNAVAAAMNQFVFKNPAVMPTDNKAIIGQLNGTNFVVTLSPDSSTATLAIANLVVPLSYSPKPDPAPRCICHVYDSDLLRLSLEDVAGAPPRTYLEARQVDGDGAVSP